MTKIRHHIEHPGCRAVFPWIRGCSRFKSTRMLLEMALRDVKGMDPVFFNSLLQNNKNYHDIAKHRSSARSAYIAHLAGWTERDDDGIRSRIGWFLEKGHGFTYGGSSPEMEFQLERYRSRQGLACNLLYAYGMIHRKTGELRFDKLDKFK